MNNKNNIRTYILDYYSPDERLKLTTLPLNGWIHPCIYCDIQTSRYKLFFKKMDRYIYFICKDCKDYKKEEISKKYLKMHKILYEL
jgi:hypothetical protein